METLFISAQIFDSFLSKRKITLALLPRIFVSCNFIACKLEEVKVYRIKDFLNNLKQQYSVREIRLVEAEILSALKWEVSYPTSLDFLKRLLCLAEKSGKEFDQICKLNR